MQCQFGKLMIALHCLVFLYVITLYLTLDALLFIRMRWLYHVPFTTYGFRAIMNLEYAGNNLTVTTPARNATEYTDLVLPSFSGDVILETFEMEGYEPGKDIGIMVVWMFCMHLVSIIYLLWYKYKTKRIFVYSDK